jgi:hypothetical protein
VSVPTRGSKSEIRRPVARGDEGDEGDESAIVAQVTEVKG